MRNGFPIATRGQKIGLLGGSFDPPHLGHVHISRRALKRFGLDQVWWIVSPGNPLKKNAPASFERRMAACKKIALHPKIVVTDLEKRLETRYTAQTLDKLKQLYGTVDFVWLMGADNLVQFHKWDRWDHIMRTVPIGVLARPGQQIAAGRSVAALRFGKYRLSQRRAGALVNGKVPRWVLLTGPSKKISSTQIRSNGEW